MWYPGAGNLTGAPGDFLAAIFWRRLTQATGWIRDPVGFPAGAGGTLAGGGSMENIIGLTAARTAMAGVDLRETGVASMAQHLRFYPSDQVHSCHYKALNLPG